MRIPIAEILGYLETQDDTIKAMGRSIASCKSKRRVDRLREEIRCKEIEYNSSVRTKENKPFCSFFNAAIYYKGSNFESAAEQLERAEIGFRGSGQERNLALSLWLHALILQKAGQGISAKSDFDKAIDIFERIAREYQRTGRYVEMGECLNIIDRIKQSISTQLKKSARQKQPLQDPFIETSKIQPVQPVSSGSVSIKRAAIPPQPVIFPIYDPVSAGKGGDFIFDSEPQGQASISELIIDEKPFRVYSMREKEPAILQPRIYRWLYVIGDSMNRTIPYPLIEGDCILVVETNSSGLSPKSNDIVVAALLDPAESADRAGVVKKYTNEGLCSVSSKDYPVIPLKKARVKGIVVAVAKPVVT